MHFKKPKKSYKKEKHRTKRQRYIATIVLFVTSYSCIITCTASLQFIAKKAGALVRALKTLESTSVAIAGFWTVEAENFESQCAKMKKNQALMIAALKDKIVKDNIDFWTKSKEEMDRYVVAMSAINNCYNFVTEAKPSEVQKVEYEQLDIIFRVPTSVQIEAIED